MGNPFESNRNKMSAMKENFSDKSDSVSLTYTQDSDALAESEIVSIKLEDLKMIVQKVYNLTTLSKHFILFADERLREELSKGDTIQEEVSLEKIKSSLTNVQLVLENHFITFGSLLNERDFLKDVILNLKDKVCPE